MNKLKLKNILLLMVIIYSVAIIYWVISDDGFYGIRILSIWSVVVMWFLIIFCIYTSKKAENNTIEEIKRYKKISCCFIFYFNAYGYGFT